jgi:integrase
MRHKTKYPGVYYREAKRLTGNGTEKVYYAVFKKNGKTIEEKVGRQHADDMTPARASRIRGQLVEGKKKTRREEKREKANKTWTIDNIWEEYKKNRKQNKALEVDEGRFEKYIKESLGKKLLADIHPLDIDRIRRNLLKKLAPQTVKHILAIVKRINNFSIKKGLAPGLNFMVEVPKVDNIKTEDLTNDQLTSLFEAIEKDTHPIAGPMMKTALYTGMRRGEMFKLRWEDIDFEKGFIFIREPKGGVGQKIPLNDAAKDLFTSLPKTSEYVFPGRKGNQRVSISHHVREIKNKAGLPDDFRPLHGLRHVYASMLASSGQVDMYTLQKLLTHKSPLMTQRYSHLRDDALKRAADIASNIITEAMKKEDQDDKSEEAGS